MRILHFSDFHLNGGSIDKAEAVLRYMMDALKAIKQVRKMDLVLFSGDMLDQGGRGFNDLSAGFKKFHEIVITPLMECLELPESHFVFTPGNHDIDRNADNEFADDGIEGRIKSFQDIIKIINNEKIESVTHRIDAFKSFEKDFYSQFDDITYTHSRFASTFEMDIDGVSVGIASLNTVWRCGFNDEHKIAMGLNQITEQCSPLKGKTLKIALTHYPISFLKEIERNEVALKSAHTFDLFFCGHSHSGYTMMHAPSKRDAFCEINSSGSLVANIYEDNTKYQNAFQIIDCDPGVKYNIKVYKQQNYQEFSLDKNLGEDGSNELVVPNTEQIVALYKLQLKELEEKTEKIKHAQIAPFVPIKDFINTPDSTFNRSEFVSSDSIDKCIAHLRDSSDDCRFMALSGMGKTRIVMETFRNMEGVFYSCSSDCIKGLSCLLRDFAPKIIVIDNCNAKSMNDAVKCMDEAGFRPRLITVYNVMTPEEKATSSDLLELTYDDTGEVVDKMVEVANIPVDKQDVAQAIVERSGRIPYMALLLIEAYKKKGTLTIDNSDAVLNAILSGNSEITELKMNVLRAISLFEPLGKDDGVSDEYDYISRQCRIHNVNLQQDVVDNEFANVIQDYEQRQLLEHEGSCIRIRPRPLAEWLTESWLMKYGHKLADVVDDINKQDESLKTRLFRAMNNRLKLMPQSKYTKQLFDELNNQQTGAFHDERIAFTKAGSQLYLSMGVVSPVAVASNLYDLLSHKSIDWLRKELDGGIRRNIVWTLENLCHSEEAFEDAAKCLAMLAVAENEEIANNATAQFVQLFHLFLSGTRADLKQRVSLLQHLREDEIYMPLLVKAIDNAFMTNGFHRSATNGLPDVVDDYQPQWNEVHFYWRDCAIVLKNILGQDETLLSAVKEMLPKHVADLARTGAKDIMFDLVDFIGGKCSYDWMKLRDALARYLKMWFDGSDEHRLELQNLLDKFTPKDYYGRLSSYIKDNHRRMGMDYDAYAREMTESMKPWVKEFLEDEIYQKDDFRLMLEDKQLDNIWFVKSLAESTKNNGYRVKICLGILNSVSGLPKDYSGSFIPLYLRTIGNDEAVHNLVNEIERAGYYRLAASVIGALDGQDFQGLSNLILGYHDGKYDDDCVNHYLHMYNYQSIGNIFSIYDKLHDGGVDERMVGYPFLVSHVEMLNLSDVKKAGCYDRYKEILLKYEYKDSTRVLGSQIVDAIERILKSTEDADFASRFHQRIMCALKDIDYSSNPFEHVYFTLLPKYQDVITVDLLEKLGSADALLAHRISLYLNLGSGFGTGKGSLFQCDCEKIKEVCLKFPNTLPARLANMCPVYDCTEQGKQESFSVFFLWLCDNFGDQKRMLDEFSANMGTIGWSGYGGFSDYIARQIPCIKPLLDHKIPTVREWAKKQMESVRSEVLREQGREAYEKMIRS